VWLCRCNKNMVLRYRCRQLAPRSLLGQGALPIDGPFCRVFHQFQPLGAIPSKLGFVLSSSNESLPFKGVLDAHRLSNDFQTWVHKGSVLCPCPNSQVLALLCEILNGDKLSNETTLFARSYKELGRSQSVWSSDS
jgi:hypothetical protein